MRTVFQGGKVFDGTGSPLAPADVLIEDGRIVEVGSDLDGDEGVDCSGKALLPGLFDCHIHLASRYEDFTDFAAFQNMPLSAAILRFPSTAMKVLRLGITTVRDAGIADAGMRQAIESGLVTGPRMQVSVAMLSSTGGHGDGWTMSGADLYAGMEYPGHPSGLCDGVDGCIAKVREVIRAGADVVKIHASGGFISLSDDPNQPTFLQEELDAIVATAGDLNRWVMAHSHGAEPTKRAVRAGVRSIEHGTFIDDDAIAMMVEAGTWLVPTLTTGDTTEAWANDPTVAEPIRAKFAALGRPELGAFRRATEAGVKVALGTDCPVAPHGTNLRELELMAENGLTPEQALMAGTSSAAELMGLQDELGTLEPGKVADVVVVDGDPYDFAKLPDRVEQVWKDGARVV